MQGSNNRFGFSLQKNLYQELQGNFSYDSANWKTFCTRVGWRKHNRMVAYKDLNFSIWAPVGHLPMMGFKFWGFKEWFPALCAHLDQCGL